MKIDSLTVYPIKSFRGISLPAATLHQHGFPYDRTFMLLQVHHAENGETTYKNMSVATFNEMVRFFPEFKTPFPPPSGKESEAVMTITHYPINGAEGQQGRRMDVPLVPDVEGLGEVDVLMHLSPTKAFRMQDHYNDWLSSCFGFECILAYISDNLREVRRGRWGRRSR